MKLHSLDTDAKTEFVKMMRTDLPEFGTTITQLINVYVRDALRYLVSEERLPELGFVQ